MLASQAFFVCFSFLFFSNAEICDLKRQFFFSNKQKSFGDSDKITAIDSQKGIENAHAPNPTVSRAAKVCLLGTQFSPLGSSLGVLTLPCESCFLFCKKSSIFVAAKFC